MQSWPSFIHERTAKIPNIRQRYPKTQYDPRLLIINQQSYLNFVSNDYLGLAAQPKLKQALVLASSKYGIGSTGAPTLSGYTAEHEKLANNLAKWLELDNCLLFSSGYQLNASIFSQLVDSHTLIWLDRNCHASHIDGILLSKAKFTTFKLNMLDNIIAQIKQQPNKRHIILTEGSFSMDGTCSYLPQLIQLKQAYPDNILLIVDDAHGIGALGTNGFGSLEQLGLNHKVIDLFIGTLSKTFASYGGFVCGEKSLINYLQQTVRSQMFSTCLPANIAATSNAALEIIQSLDGAKLRDRLAKNINYFQQLSKEYNLPLYHSASNVSPIQFLVFKDENTVKQLFNQLLNQDILVGQILFPTVATSAPRIRISLTASHTRADIKLLCNHLAKVCEYDTN